MKPQVNRLARDLAVEQSLDAAIEIDEVIRDVRGNSPAFEKLVTSFIGSPAGDFSAVKKDLLSDSRLASLYYRAAKSSGRAEGNADDMDHVLGLLLSAGSVNLSKISKDDLAIVRDFCVSLNQELVSEAFSRTPEPPLARSRQQRFASIDACRI